MVGWATPLPKIDLLAKLSLWQRLCVLAVPMLLLWVALNAVYSGSGWQAFTISVAICWPCAGVALGILYFCRTANQIATGMLFAMICPFIPPLAFTMYVKNYTEASVFQQRIDWIVAFFLVGFLSAILLAQHAVQPSGASE